MNKIIDDMKAPGVVKCGATHCTGVKQTQMIKEAFGSNFFELGVGNNIVLNQAVVYRIHDLKILIAGAVTDKS